MHITDPSLCKSILNILIYLSFCEADFPMAKSFKPGKAVLANMDKCLLQMLYTYLSQNMSPLLSITVSLFNSSSNDTILAYSKIYGK